MLDPGLLKQRSEAYPIIYEDEPVPKAIFVKD